MRRMRGPASLYHLPTEVLARIIDFGREIANHNVEQSGCKGIGDGCQLGFTLQLVSRRFYLLANSIKPSLWSTIHIIWSSHQHALERDQIWAETCLRKSPSRHLYIWIHAGSNGHESVPNHFKGPGIYTLLAAEADRIASIEITLPQPWLFINFFRVFATAHMPVLTNLRLHSAGVALGAANSSPAPIFTGGAPHLRELRHSNVRFEDFYSHFGSFASSVTRLVIEQPVSDSRIPWDACPWRDLCYALSGLPALEHLEYYHSREGVRELKQVNWVFRGQPVIRTPFITPNLISLIINRGTQALLQLLITPNLESLTLVNVEPDYITSLNLPHLHTLRLVDHSLYKPKREANFDTLFAATPSLTQLIIEKCEWPGATRDPSILVALSTAPHAWPHLSNITTIGLTLNTLSSLILHRSGRTALKALFFQHQFMSAILPFCPADVANCIITNGIHVQGAPKGWALFFDKEWNGWAAEERTWWATGRVPSSYEHPALKTAEALAGTWRA